MAVRELGIQNRRREEMNGWVELGWAERSRAVRMRGINSIQLNNSKTPNLHCFKLDFDKC